MNPILYLELRQFVNFLRYSLTSPKRLIPAIFLVLYFGQMILFPLIASHSRAATLRQSANLSEMQPTLQAVLMAAVLLVSVYLLLKSFSSGTIVYSLAEIDFLFPTPVIRRRILTFKLLKLYARFAVYGVFLLLILTPFFSTVTACNGLCLLFAWISLSIFAFLLINVCTIISLTAHYQTGRRWWLGIAIKGIAVGLASAAVIGVLAGYLRTGDIIGSAIKVFTHPVFLTAALPAKWAVDLMLSPFTGWRPGLWGEFAALSILMAASFALAIRRKENPYEPSLSISVRAAAIRTAWRTRDFSKMRSEQWKRKASGVKSCIAPFGRGAAALIWKNINISLRTSGSSLLVVLALIIIGLPVLSITLGRDVCAEIVPMCATFILPYILIMLSISMMHTFRGDMKQANILKPMPIPAWQFVAAQTVHGTLVITLLAWLIIGMTAILFGVPPRSPMLLVALALPFLVQNALSSQVFVAALYPNWDDFGQRFIGGLLSMLAILISLGPPVAVGVLIWILKVNIVIAFPIVACMALGISAAGIALGGYVYKRSDPTGE